MKRFQITEAEYEAIKAKEAKTKDKNISRRLRVLMLRYEGKKLDEITKMTNLHRTSITQMCRRYREHGLEEYARNKYQSHRWLLRQYRTNELVRWRMHFLSDAIAEIEGLLEVNRDFCKKQMAEKASPALPTNCAVVPKRIMPLHVANGRCRGFVYKSQSSSSVSGESAAFKLRVPGAGLGSTTPSIATSTRKR